METSIKKIAKNKLQRFYQAIRGNEAPAPALTPWQSEKSKSREWLHANSLQRQFPQYQIGRASYGNPSIEFSENGGVLSIGNFCSLASNVKILLGGEHRPDWVSTYPFNLLFKSAWEIQGHPRTKGDVIIGHDVWIGMEAIIMSGVTIGNGAVIGARAVVVKDVPPYAIIAGNPARLVKFRFDNKTISRLQNLEWWNWPDQKIEEYLPLMLTNQIDTFLTLAEHHPQDE